MAMKKKLKNWIKSQKHVSPKAKKKAARAKKIHKSHELRDSKRKGSEAVSELKQKLKQEEKLSSLKTVDSLFATLGDEDSEDERCAFEDDEGPSRLGVSAADLLDEECVGPAACKRHAKELQVLKGKDPDFYKFLLAEDRALLNFSMRDGEGDKEDEKAEQVAPMAVAAQGRCLDKERMSRMHSLAKDSYTAAKACLNAYHIAVRFLEAAKTSDKAEDQEGKTEGSKKLAGMAASGQRRDRENMLRIDDADVCSEVIEWTTANMLSVIKHHAGELLDDSETGGKKKKKSKSKKVEAGGNSGPVDPTNYQRWKRVKAMAQIFWDETFMLLSQLQDQKMVEHLLRHCSSEEAMSWLWPFRLHRQLLIKRCCRLWSSAATHAVCALAFLFLRNVGAMVLHKPDPKLPTGTQLQNLLKLVFANFADAASRGSSWKSLGTFRFLENCIVELLRLDDACTYRLGFASLRQLAKILRDTSTGKTKDTGSEKKKSSNKAGVTISWAFVRSMYLWTKAVALLPALRPLAYPLSMIILGASKSELTNLKHFPFFYHCLVALNRLASSTETFFPVASHLLKCLGIAMQSFEKPAKSKKRGRDKPRVPNASGKAPEMEVLLRLSEAQLSENSVLEAVVGSLAHLLTDHLGLLSQSPAFPEIVVPVLIHLRRAGKQGKSEALRRQLKTLKEKVELSATEVRSKRDAFEELPDAKKFLVLEPSTPIAKARVEALKRKAAEEEARVKAEIAKAETKAAEEGAIAMDGDGDGDATRKEEEEEEGEAEGRGEKKVAVVAKAAERRTPAAQAQGAAKKAKTKGASPKQEKVEAKDLPKGEEN